MRSSHLKKLSIHSPYSALAIAVIIFAFNAALAQPIFAQTFAPLPLRINAGGHPVDVTGTDGKTWLTDRYFTGGRTLLGTVNSAVPPVPREVWTSMRTGTAQSDFRYVVSVPNGTYRVTLYLAEVQIRIAGKRVFNVLVNGTTVLPNLDIFAEAGFANSLTKVLPNATVSNQTLQIAFQRSGENPPVVSGILVEQISGPPPAPTITVSPDTVDLKGSQTRQFTAALTGVQPTTVTWSVSGALAALGTISSGGLYTAPANVAKSGPVTIRATSTAMPSLTDTATVNLLASIGVTVSPANPSVTSGQTAQFTATVTGTSNTAVTWSASAGSISTSGLFTAPVVTTPTTVQITARSVADTAIAGTATATVNPAVTTGPLTYLESGGLVVMEVERGSIVNRSGKTWSAATGVAGFSGPGYLTSLPNIGFHYPLGTYLNVAPEIQLSVRFTTPGTYYIWARGNAATWADDSIHVGLNDLPVTTGETLSNFAVQTPAVWSWAGSEMDTFARRTLNIPSAGVHKVNIWMREDGLHLDRLILTRDSQLQPTGVGPAESATDSTEPILSVSPAALTFAAVEGGAKPPSQNVSVQNLGGKALSWTASANQPWVSFLPASGQAPATVAIGVNPAGLTAGTHTATVTIDAPGVQGAPKTVAVTLNITAPIPATLSVTPPSLTFSATAGGANPAAQPLSITNAAAGAINWTAQSSAAWLKISAPSGSTPATLNVSADIAGLTANTYTGSVTITSPGAGGSPKVIGVTLTVGAAAAQSLNVLPGTLAFTTISGGANPSPQTLSVTNGGGGSFGWTVQSNQTWLAVNPAAGSTPGSISATVSIAGLAAGTYNGTVTVTAAGIPGSPKQIPVTLTIQAPGTGRTYYMAPTGTSGGDGSIGRPWDIESVLSGAKPVRPGDTVYMRGGTYGTGFNYYNAFLAGDATAPVIVRQYPGERAIVNAAIQVWGRYVWYWGFELAILTNVSRYDSSRFPGVSIYGGPDVRLINLVVHDTGGGLAMWTAGPEAEAYGCIVYNNGYQGPTRGHGHGVYTQNNAGVKKIHESIFFNQFGWGIHAYGSDAAFIRNYDMQGNISFNNGSLAAGNVRSENVLFTGGTGVENIVFSNNFTYNTPTLNYGSNSVGVNGSGPNRNLVANGNHFIGGQTALNLFNWDRAEFRNNVVFSSFTPLSMGNQGGENLAGYSWDANTYHGTDAFYHNLTRTTWAGYRTRTGLDRNSTFTPGRPTGVWKFVRPNKYEPGRANIVIYNWNLNPTVDVDLSGILPVGSDFEIRNVQDWSAAPVLSGRYNGGSVTLPMTGLTVAQPLGVHPTDAVPTGPEFNVFVVMKR